MNTVDEIVKAMGTIEIRALIDKGEELIEQSRYVHQENTFTDSCRNTDCGICKIRKGMKMVIDEFNKIKEEELCGHTNTVLGRCCKCKKELK